MQRDWMAALFGTERLDLYVSQLFRNQERFVSAKRSLGAKLKDRFSGTFK